MGFLEKFAGLASDRHVESDCKSALQPSCLSEAQPPGMVLLQTALAAFFGATFFLWLFGVQPLDPANIGWLMHGDPAQHYLGWQFFRGESWHWPPGRIENFGAPIGAGIVFTDSIPLLAFLFKPLSPWLPAEFQYFGAWMLFCYMLSAVFGWRLMAHATPHGRLRTLGTLLFLMSPAMLLRAYGHESLMAHWLLLAGFDRYAAPWRGSSWLALLLVAVLVHPYLFLMTLALAAAALIRAFMLEKTGARLLWQMALGTIVLLMVMWGAGYFIAAPHQLSAEGYGHYSANLSSYVDPMDWHSFLHSYGRDTAGKYEWSQFLKPRGQATTGQYEGFAYLGLGALILAPYAFAHLLTQPPRWRVQQFWLPLLMVCVALFAAALSHKITLGSKVLIEIPWTPNILKALSVFRASGRFVWPLYYLLLWAVLAAIVHYCPLRLATVLLIIGITLQFTDLRKKFAEFRHQPTWQTPLKDPLWEQAALRYHNFSVIPTQLEDDAYIPLAHLAALHGAAIDAGYVARPDNAALKAYADKQSDNIAEGRLRSDTLYILPQGEELAALLSRLSADVEIRSADGYVLLLPPSGM
ncbi:MAG: DUF6311 domain-containing protein [Methylococcales bacterium]|nr:DUF6311 domain-containing protein [Methylococcales bacterium]